MNIVFFKKQINSTIQNLQESEKEKASELIATYMRNLGLETTINEGHINFEKTLHIDLMNKIMGYSQGVADVTRKLRQ